MHQKRFGLYFLCMAFTISLDFRKHFLEMKVYITKN